MDAERFQRLASLAEGLPEAVMAMDIHGRITEWGVGATRLFGWAREEALGQPGTLVAPPERKEEIQHNLTRLVRGEAVVEFQTVRVRKDGSTFDASVTLAPVRGADGALVGMWGLVRDATPQRNLERRLSHLESAFAILDGLTGIVGNKDELAAVFREACRIAVERGGLRMAWIGRVDPVTKRVAPVAHAGHEAGYLAATEMTVTPQPRGMGPSGRAIRERRPVLSADVANDPAMAPWRDAALARGYRSSAAFPIVRGDEVVAMMAVYASEPDFFTPSATRILAAMANLLSLACALRPGEI